MTAPDPRDSVERIVAEMRIPHEGGWDNDDVQALADRLSALPQPFTPNAKLARAMAGAQEAGGEDVQRFRMGVAATGCGTYAQPNASPKGEWVRYTDYAALQAEVARLKGELSNRGDYVNDALLKRAEAAEAALRDANLEALRMVWSAAKSNGGTLVIHRDALVKAGSGQLDRVNHMDGSIEYRARD